MQSEEEVASRRPVSDEVNLELELFRVRQELKESNLKGAVKHARVLLGGTPNDVLALSTYDAFLQHLRIEYLKEATRTKMAVLGQHILTGGNASIGEQLLAARALAFCDVHTREEQLRSLRSAQAVIQGGEFPEERTTALAILACQVESPAQVKEYLSELLQSEDACNIFIGVRGGVQRFVEEEQEYGVRAVEAAMGKVHRQVCFSTLEEDRRKLLQAQEKALVNRLASMNRALQSTHKERWEGAFTAYERLSKIGKDPIEKARGALTLAFIAWKTGHRDEARSFVAVALERLELLLDGGNIKEGNALLKNAREWSHYFLHERGGECCS